MVSICFEAPEYFVFFLNYHAKFVHLFEEFAQVFLYLLDRLKKPKYLHARQIPLIKISLR